MLLHKKHKEKININFTTKKRSTLQRKVLQLKNKYYFSLYTISE